MNDSQKAYFQLHASVVLWGFTAILGKLISVSALTLVWWRMLITSISILLLMRGVATLRKYPRKTILKVMGIGILVGLHWLAFYGSIKYANASVAVVCISTMSLFAAILEPFFTRGKIQWFDLSIGIIIIPAMMLIMNHLDTGMTKGFLIGIVGALLAACFAVLNKMMLKDIDPIPMTFLEIASGWLFVSLIVPFYLWQNPEVPFLPSTTDWCYLIVLSLLCTTLPYIMSLYAMQKISAFTSILAVNLEPVYGIFLAWILLGENKELNPQFYLGVAIILGSVFLHPMLKKRFE